SDAEMERFIGAVRGSDTPKYYLPEEIKPEMYGRKIRIIGGKLNGYEGCLLTTRGSKVKRLLVELPNFFSVGVEVNPDMIEFIRG
ncbi:MAG: transcriptional regulator, partial [Bacteroidales bacterium]